MAPSKDCTNDSKGSASREQSFPISDGGSDHRISEILSALSNQRRRYVLYILQHEPVNSLEKIATQIASWEQVTDTHSLSNESIEQVKTSLHHNHLPHLVKAGLIEYDERSTNVRYRDTPVILDKFMSICENIELQDPDSKSP